jgi:uncharacterized protein YgbK (DUF1537 family)
VIVADDLTGAADACATFVTHGLSGTVAFGGPAGRGGAAGADVIAVSTDSRSRSSAIAMERVREAVRFATAFHGSALLFKKIDSTLRGHVGEEVRAAIDASRARVAVVAPAFPAMGRTVEYGMLRVAGPITGAGAIGPRHVAGRLESHGVRQCRRIPRPAAAMSAGTGTGSNWRDRMDEAIRDGARALVCDCVDDADLDGIVEAAWTLEGPVLWVGSAGLAYALARRLGTPAAADAPGPVGPRGPVIMWIGSHHPVTVAQQQYVAQGHGRPPVTVVSEAEIEAASACLDSGTHVLVDISRQSSNEVIARMVASVIDRPLAGFVMSGGDTAARVCRMLDAACIELAGEVSRGIPWGWLRTRTGRRWPVVLKSGGFGGEDALHHALACLSGERPGD